MRDMLNSYVHEDSAFPKYTPYQKLHQTGIYYSFDAVLYFSFWEEIVKVSFGEENVKVAVVTSLQMCLQYVALL